MILFCIQDMDGAVNAAFPIVEICTQVTGSLRATTAMVSGLILISSVVTMGSIASASVSHRSTVSQGHLMADCLKRLTWAWARDGGLPAWFSHISPRHRVPVRSIWLPSFIVMCLACLNIASYAAFGAFIALSTLALFASYAIAIGCMLRARLQNKVVFGGWNLGRFGVPINIFALIYSGWIMVICCFVSPAYPCSAFQSSACTNALVACICAGDRFGNELRISNLRIRRPLCPSDVVPESKEELAGAEQGGD